MQSRAPQRSSVLSNEAPIAPAENNSFDERSKAHIDEPRRDTNLAVLYAFETFRRETLERGARFPTESLKAQFISAFNARDPQLDLPPSIYEERLKLSKRTLERLLGNGGMALKRGRRRGSGRFQRDSQIMGFIQSRLFSRPNHVTATAIEFDIANAGNFAAKPSRATIRRVMRAVKKLPEFLALRNPDKFRSRFGARLGKAYANVSAFNELLQMDGTSCEVLIIVGGKLVRFQILVLVDCFSGLIKISVAPSESGDACARLLRLWIIERALPRTIVTDNGSGWRNRRIVRVLRDVGINIIFLPAHRPELKGLVEAAIKVITHQLFERLPGFAGHNVAQKQAIQNERSFAERFGESARTVFSVGLDLPAFTARCSDFENILNNRVNSRTGRVPEADAIAAALMARHPDERALDALLGAGDGRLIGPDGIRWKGGLFLPRQEFAAAYGAKIGRRGLVLEGEDAGRLILYSESPEGRRFVAICENESSLGHSRRAIAIAAKTAQREFIAQSGADARRLIREMRPNIISARAFANAAAGARSSRLRLLETATVPSAPNFSTAALDAGRDAADALDAIGESAPRAITRARIGNDGDARFARYQALKARAASMLSDEDSMFVRAFESSPAFRARRAAGLAS